MKMISRISNSIWRIPAWTSASQRKQHPRGQRHWPRQCRALIFRVGMVTHRGGKAPPWLAKVVALKELVRRPIRLLQRCGQQQQVGKRLRILGLPQHFSIHQHGILTLFRHGNNRANVSNALSISANAANSSARRSAGQVIAQPPVHPPAFAGPNAAQIASTVRKYFITTLRGGMAFPVTHST